MPPFVSAPKPASERIPVITIADLVDALAQYLPSISRYSHHAVHIECDRQFKETTIRLHSIAREFENPLWFTVTIEEKAASTLTARLWNTPFQIVLSGETVHGPRIWLHIEPRPKRAVAITRVAKFEGGVPVLVE